MTNHRTMVVASSLAALAFVSGCTSTRPHDRLAAKPSIDGEWVGSDGVAVSAFEGGRFTSRSSATGEKLTEGTYTYRNEVTIDLSFFSVRSKQNTTAACQFLNADQMNCALASGTQFVLMRQRPIS